MSQDIAIDVDPNRPSTDEVQQIIHALRGLRFDLSCRCTEALGRQRHL